MRSQIPDWFSTLRRSWAGEPNNPLCRTLALRVPEYVDHVSSQRGDVPTSGGGLVRGGKDGGT